jgi:FkbM family methyltransferase
MSTLSTIYKGLRRPHELLRAGLVTPSAHKLVGNYLNFPVEFPIDIPLRWGGAMRLSDREEARVFWHVFVHHCYRLWPDCRTIIDAGANVGSFSIWAARRLPCCRILALEPFPETFAQLRRNLESTGLLLEVTPLNYALAAAPGTRQMNPEFESPRRCLIPIDEKEKGVPVSSVTLKELLDRHHVREVDLLKMDIEGCEHEVLYSTPPEVFARIRRIQFEYHVVHKRFGYTREKLFAHLERNGYSITHEQKDQRGTGIAVAERSEWVSDDSLASYLHRNP